MSAIDSNKAAVVKYEHIDVKLDADQFIEMCPKSEELDIKQEDAISIKSEDETEEVLDFAEDNDIKTESKGISTRKVFKCPLCDYKSFKRSNLSEHKLRHSKIKPLICTECSYKSAVKRDFQRHVARHSKEKKFKCSQCLFSTYFTGELKIHVEKKHEQALMYRCDKCSFTTAYRNNFKLHKKIHMRKILHCDKCAYATTFEKRMLRHKERHVRFDKHNEYVQNIMTSNNMDDNSYECTLCDYSSKFIASLVTHMKTHQVT